MFKKLVRKALVLIQSRFVGFSIVGGIVYIIGLTILATQIEILHENKIVAGIITTILSLQINFLLNRYFNWHDRKGKFGDHWIRFHIARIGTIVFGQVWYITFVSLGVHYLLVSISGNAIAWIFNYVTSDRFVFRKEKKKNGRPNSTCVDSTPNRRESMQRP